MNAQLRAELLKLRSTRTPLVLLLIGVATVLLGDVALGLSSKLPDLAQEKTQRDMFGSASGAILFATYVGLIAVTGEFRYRTIRPTLLVQPRRRVVLQAKLAAAALVGAAFGAAGVVASFLCGLPILRGRNVDFVVGGGHVAWIAGGTVAASAFCALLGVAVGALVRNQLGAIMALGAWSLAVESVLFGVVPGIGRWLPGEAGNALAGLGTSHLLPPAVGAAVLVAWTIAFVAAARLHDERSDVA